MLKVEAVRIRFGNGPEVVRDAAFTVGDGSRLAVIGETGSGKSVLLLAILGLLPGSAQVSGRILLDGLDLLSCRERELNRIRGGRIAYIPQGSGNGLNPLYTIGRQLCETIRKHRSCSRSEAMEQAMALLKAFGLERELCKRYPFQLSGGMRQRVLVAMGIAAGADFVLADEPTKGLDRRRIAMVEDTFRQLGDRSLLCVTHDLRFAQAIASQVIVMYASQQIETGTREEFFGAPLHPYSQAMLQALPERGLQANIGFAPPRSGEGAHEGCHFYARCPQRTARCVSAPPLADVGARKVRCWLYAD